MRITYSVGRSARDNRPQLAYALSFDEYKLAIKALKKRLMFLRMTQQRQCERKRLVLIIFGVR